MKKLTFGLTAIFVLCASFTAYAQESAKEGKHKQVLTQQGKTSQQPDLPDFTKAPYYLVQEVSGVKSLLHSEWPEFNGKLYANVQVNPDGTTQVDKNTSEISLIMVFYNLDGTICYAECQRLQVTKRASDGTPIEGEETLRGYIFSDGKFIFDKELPKKIFAK